MLCVDDDEHEWIVSKCRKGWDEHVGKQTETVETDALEPPPAFVPAHSAAPTAPSHSSGTDTRTPASS